MEKNELMKKMVDRFLGWKLPESFNPDGGIVFTRVTNEGTAWAHKNEPVGTNVFTAVEARAMVEYMLEGIDLNDASDS